MNTETIVSANGRAKLLWHQQQKLHRSMHCLGAKGELHCNSQTPHLPSSSTRTFISLLGLIAVEELIQQNQHSYSERESQLRPDMLEICSSLFLWSFLYFSFCLFTLLSPFWAAAGNDPNSLTISLRCYSFLRENF